MPGALKVPALYHSDAGRLRQQSDFSDQMIDTRKHELDRCFVDEAAVLDFLINTGNHNLGPQLSLDRVADNVSRS